MRLRRSVSLRESGSPPAKTGHKLICLRTTPSHRKSLSPLGPPPAEDRSPTPGGHANEKAVSSFPLRVARRCQILLHEANLLSELIKEFH